MTTLTARYGFNEPRSRLVQRPDNPLCKAMEKWLDNLPTDDLPGMLYYDKTNKGEKAVQRFYVTAITALQGLPETSIGELHAAALCFKGHPKAKAIGLFLSAGYNVSPERDIEFDMDMDTRLDFLGYRLGKGKKLYVRADVGDQVGYKSNGAGFYNFASVRGEFGFGSSGNFGNYGEVSGFAAECKGRILNKGKANIISPKFDSKQPKTINFGTVVTMNVSGVGINLGDAEDMYADDGSTAVNFNNIKGDMVTKDSSCIINAGTVEGEMGEDAKNSSIVLAIKNPGTLHVTDTMIFMDEKECTRFPGIVEYFDRLKASLEARRNDSYQDFHKVFKELNKALPIPEKIAKLSGRRDVLKYLW